MPAALGYEQLQLIMVDPVQSIDPNTGQLIVITHNYVWNATSGQWEKETQPGGGGGGGPVTIADGDDVVEGSLADAAITTDAAGTVNAKLRGLIKILSDVWDDPGNRFRVDASGAAIDVTDRAGRLVGQVTVDNFPADQLVHATNLDVLLSTRLKPADTLAGVTTVGTITNPVSTKTPLTGSAPIAVSVGVASGLAVAANAGRKGLTLTNTSVNRISVGIGNAAVLDSGITLLPGGVWEMDEFTFSTAVINAIASAAASNLAIQEFT